MAVQAELDFLSVWQKITLATGGQKPSFEQHHLKVKNKWRDVYAPDDAMRRVHEALLEYLKSLPVYEVLRKSHVVVGGIADKSILWHLKPHRRAEVRSVVLLDIKDAYPNTSVVKMAKALCFADPALDEEETKEFLRTHCFLGERGLILGGPAALLLFNVYCYYFLDRPLLEILSRFGGPRAIAYTRYVDDFVFSSDLEISRELIAWIRQVLAAAGFEENHTKTKFIDLRKGPVRIAGLLLCKGGRVAFPRKDLVALKGLLVYLLTKDGNAERPAYVFGKIAWFKMHVFGKPREEEPTRLERQVMKLIKRYAKMIKALNWEPKKEEKEKKDWRKDWYTRTAPDWD